MIKIAFVTILVAGLIFFFGGAASSQSFIDGDNRSIAPGQSPAAGQALAKGQAMATSQVQLQVPFSGGPPAPLSGGRGSGGPDIYRYTWKDSDEVGGPTYSWVEINTTGTPLGLDKEDWSSLLDLGFTFTYYGNDYTQIAICSNGWLSFDAITDSAWENYPIPDKLVPNNLLAPFWDDLDPTSATGSGEIYYYKDTANSRFIVEFDGVDHDASGTKPETFQCILNSDGTILFQYKTVTDGQTCSVGIENETGTIGLEVALNSSSYLKSNHAILFTPPGPVIPASFPFFDSFESGVFGAMWTTEFEANGRVRVRTGYPYSGTYFAALDTFVTGTLTTASMTLAIDLSEAASCTLEFRFMDFGDEPHSEDGIFISDDGITFHEVLSLQGYTLDVYHLLSVDIAQAAAIEGLTLNDNFRIRFSWRDNWYIASDGFGFDDICVTGDLTQTKTLSTLFTSDNTSAGNTFDILPSQKLEIQAINVNHTGDPGSTVSADVWYKTGTCVGFEQNAAAWTLLATGTGTSVGVDSSTYIDLPGAAGTWFESGQTYGIYVDLGSSCSFTNGGGTPYSNDDLTLTPNAASAASFGAQTASAIWNGTLYYQLEPTLVELDWLKALGYGGTAAVAWETASEIDTAGFHVWRSRNRWSDYQRITPQLIPARGSAFRGARYLIFDRTVKPGQRYFYKLEDIDYGWESTFHPPQDLRWWRPKVDEEN